MLGLSKLMNLMLSFVGLAAYLTVLPIARLARFGEVGKSRPNQRGHANHLLSSGGLLESLFSVMSGSIRIPIVYRYYEPAVSSHLIGVRGRTFVDMGAHHGHYCCLLAGNFSQLVAIEPEPGNYRVMQLVFRLRSIRPVVLSCAVTDQDGTTRLFLSPDKASHRVDHVPPRNISKQALVIRTVTVGSLVKHYGDLDLVKVDVEGAEWLVLKGAETVTDKVIRWAIELHDPRRQRELEEWMRGHGYHYTWLDPDHIYSWRP